MNNSSTVILNKTIQELHSKREQIEQELYDVNNTITSIEKLMLNAAEVPLPTIKQVKPKKRRKRSRQTSRAIITENSVRDAIIDLVKNPAPNFSGSAHELHQGYFVCSQIGKRMGVTPNQKINQIVNKFEEKGLLESREYKSGKQYKYIKPVDSGPIIKNYSAGTVPPEISNPIPGINNNGITTRDKDIEKLLKTAQNQNFVITRLGSGHIRISTPNLKRSFSVSGTGNKRYELTKVRADLISLGVKL